MAPLDPTTLTCPPSSCSLMPFSGKDCLVLRKGSVHSRSNDEKTQKTGCESKNAGFGSEDSLSGDRVSCVELESGETFSAEAVVSTCGALKTQEMLDERLSAKNLEEGRFTIVESMSVYEGSPRDFDWKETVVFFNDSSTFDYSEPTELIDLRSGVICMPENYEGRPVRNH